MYLGDYTPGSTNIAVAGNWGPRIESMYIFPIEHGDHPASYVSLQGGNPQDFVKTQVFVKTQRLFRKPRKGCLTGPATTRP